MDVLVDWTARLARLELPLHLASLLGAFCLVGVVENLAYVDPLTWRQLVQILVVASGALVLSYWGYRALLVVLITVIPSAQRNILYAAFAMGIVGCVVFGVGGAMSELEYPDSFNIFGAVGMAWTAARAHQVRLRRGTAA